MNMNLLMKNSSHNNHFTTPQILHITLSRDLTPWFGTTGLNHLTVYKIVKTGS